MQSTQNLAHVYVIKNELGLVKIGFATNPQKRFASIESSSGLKIVDSYVSPICFNYAEIEKALHAQFEPFRKAGEWFDTDFNTIVTAANNHFNTQSDSKELAPFNFNGHELRVITDDKGESWFIAKDVCEALELDDTSKAVSRLDDDEKGTRKVRTLGGMQEMNCINESGLYALILRSNKPQAKPFRKWVTSEVLPAIRKTGSYGQASQQQPLDEATRDFLTATVRQVVGEMLVTPKSKQQHSQNDMPDVPAFFKRYGKTRFIDEYSAEHDHQVPDNFAGFRKTNENGITYYYMLSRVFEEELCRGYNSKLVKKQLTKQGIFMFYIDSCYCHDLLRKVGLIPQTLYQFTDASWQNFRSGYSA